MAEESTYSKVPYTTLPDGMHKGKEVSFFTTEGSPKNKAGFRAAIDQFEKDGTTPLGYTALDKNTAMEVARSAFEFINTPVQGAIRAATKGLESQVTDPTSSIQDTPSSQSALGLSKLLPFIGEQVNTPGKAGMTAGTALALPAAGPLLGGVKALRQTSGALPGIIRGIGAGVGTGIANTATGTGATESPATPLLQKVQTESFINAIGVAGSEGLLGLLTKGIGTKAVRQAEDAMFDVIRKEYPQLTFKGAKGVEEFAASAPARFEKLVQRGIKSLKAEGDNAGKQFMDEVAPLLPSALSKSTRMGIERHVDRYRDVVNEMFDNIADPAKVTNLRKQANEISKDIIDAVTGEFKGKTANVANAARLQSIFNKYQRQEGQFLAGAEIIDDIRQSMVGGKFNLQALQERLKTRLYSTTQMREDVSLAASRGQPMGVDRERRLGLGPMLSHVLPVPDSWKGAISRFGPSMPGGTAYTGAVRDVPSLLPIDVVTANQFRDFMQRKSGTPE